MPTGREVATSDPAAGPAAEDPAEELAKRLLEAIRARTPIAPLTADHPELTLEDAYRIQDRIVRALGGREAAKLGLTSAAKQRQMHVDAPLWGWLAPGSRLLPGEPLAVSELIHPRVEPEIAFVLGRDLAGPATIAHVLAATERVVPALDVLDSRFHGYRFTLADVVADDASAARYALGGPGAAVEGLDLRLVGCRFVRNGKTVATAAGAAVLGHPAAAVAWLATELARRGERLRAGTTVLAGALTEAVAVDPGDRVAAVFDRLGTVELICA
jgi:2-keto-4-pentenoate hydratase